MARSNCRQAVFEGGPTCLLLSSQGRHELSLAGAWSVRREHGEHRVNDPSEATRRWFSSAGVLTAVKSSSVPNASQIGAAGRASRRAR
jgi:hypothetical protein